MTIKTEDVVDRAPKYRCLVCEALWVKHDDGTWSLKSNHCGQCCDNAPMGGQMIAVADMDAWKSTVEKFRRAASVRGMSDMRAYLTVRALVEAAPSATPIERLREENARRGEALKPFAAIGDNFTDAGGWSVKDKIELVDGFRVLDKLPVAAFREARAALTSSADDDK